ncbi:MAG: DMT family transporter [Gammaproteobacteria bacterium]|nr:DMT family transporter [Gammaproteobacteria bacterium]
MGSTPGPRPILYLVFLGGSWGLYFSMLKIAALSGISYPGILTLATVGVAIGMSAIALLRRRRPLFSLRHIIFYLVCALSGYLVPMIAEVLVIAHMPAGVLTLIVSMAPLATLLFAWILKTDVINSSRVAGIILGAIAIFAILLPDAHLSEAVAWHWLLLAMVVPVCYAIHHNFTARYWPPDSDSYQVACGEALCGSFLLVMFSMFNWQWQDVQSWNQGHSAILFMAAISLIDIYLYFELIRIKGPIFTSNANYFMVISGVLWGIVIFAERPSSWMWLSVLLLIGSLYLIGKSKTGEDQAHANEI